MTSPRRIRIGTWSSPMALAQVERVRAELAAHVPDLVTEVVPITTSGDRSTGSPSAPGGKGALTKEVDAALLASGCDLAVHCMKDVPGDRPVPAGTVFAAYLARDDIRDAVVHPGGLTLDQLPGGARVGTSAVRRTAQLAHHLPHLQPVPIRGNADTRLAKLDAGEVDALLLGVAGLHRIGQAERVSEVLPVEAMCPPIGAGVVGLQCRQDDTDTVEAVGRLGDTDTRRQITAERALLRVLQGNCNSAIAGYAHTGSDSRLTLHGKVLSPDGKTVLDADATADQDDDDPTALGTSVALALLRQGAHDIIDAVAR